MNIYDRFLVVTGLKQDLIIGRDLRSKYQCIMDFTRGFITFNFKVLLFVLSMWEQNDVQQRSGQEKFNFDDDEPSPKGDEELSVQQVIESVSSRISVVMRRMR